MKTQILHTLSAFCLSAMLGSVCLNAQNIMTAKIPFDFTVGTKSFTAGEYIVRSESARPVLALESADHKSAIMALTQDVHTRTPLSKGKLVFNRYGDQYFLSQVWRPGATGRQLPKSSAEKEMIAKAKAPQP